MSEKTEKQPRSVFISYAHNDAEQAKILAQQCNSFGLDAWLGDEELHPGENWLEKIEKAVKSCRIAIVLISKDAFSSRWVNKEWSALCEEKWSRPDIKIIPIRLENTKAPPFLCEYQEYSTEKGEIDYKLFKDHLKKYLETKVITIDATERKKEIQLEVERLENRVRDLKVILEKSREERGRSNGD